MTRRLLEGSEAIADAMVAAGCRFFAGYPMTPFTEVLEHMGRKLPEAGGVCMNAESELEAVGMAWGAAATGARAATGSTGQGLSLMQESLSEITLARLPLVVLNMARAQGDYFQATRGGGHGDYRHIVLAPADVPEAVELVQLAFHLADTWRNPVLVFGDYYLAHTVQSVEVTARDPGPVPPRDWALDGSSGGSGRAKLVSPLGDVKQRDDVGYDLADWYGRAAAAVTAMSQGVTPLVETLGIGDAAATRDVGDPRGLGDGTGHVRADPTDGTGDGVDRRTGGDGDRGDVGGDDGEGLDLVVVAFGTPGRYVRAAVRELRAEGARVGFVRPITLFPFPTEAVAAAAQRARAVAVYENNQGQMIDDVRLAVLGTCPVHFIGGLSLDSSGFGIAPDLDVPVLRRRIEDVLARPDTTRGAA